MPENVPNNTLFVCKKGLYRSPRAVRWYIGKCRQLYDVDVSGNVRSAGTTFARRGTYLKQEVVDWAARIFAMDEEVAEYIGDHYFGTTGKVVRLHVPDDDYDHKDGPQRFDAMMEIQMMHHMDRGCVGVPDKYVDNAKKDTTDQLHI